MIDCDVSEELSLVERLEETPAGVELSGLLASVDRSRLDCGGLLKLAAARQRQVAFEEAQLLADLWAVARACPDEGLSDSSGRYVWAGVEVAMGLRWSRGRAAAQLGLAGEVIDRLPALFDALSAGRLDVPKVLVFTTMLDGTDTELARALVDKLIDQAQGWTAGQLRARLRRLLIAADPAAAHAKAKRQVKDRRVIAWLDDDSHLAFVSGQSLAPHRVAAVMERLDAVAKAARAGGDERTPDQIRADVFLDLLTGEGIAAGGPVTDGAWGLVDPGDPTSHDPLTDERDTAAAEAAWAPAPDTPPPGDPATDVADTPDPPAPGPLVPEPVDSLWPLPPDDGLDPTRPDTATQRDAWLAIFDQLPPTRPATWCVLCGHVTGTVTSPGPMPGPRRGVIELVATLDTLAGLADLPAELTGMGPVTADIARHITTQIRDSQWRYSIYDPLTHLNHHGNTTQRPTTPVDETGRDPQRFPTTTQTAWIHARDRVCVAPGCRRPARSCDIDHTLDWVKGGRTTHCNLALLCRGHHLFKHATGSELIQSVPGIFHWSTPAGLQYTTRSQPPLILNPNHLAGIPKPPNPDTASITANHTLEQWAQPSSHGEHPHWLTPDDLLQPEDIDDPDNLPQPRWKVVAGSR